MSVIMIVELRLRIESEDKQKEGRAGFISVVEQLELHVRSAIRLFALIGGVRDAPDEKWKAIMHRQPGSASSPPH